MFIVQVAKYQRCSATTPNTIFLIYQIDYHDDRVFVGTLIAVTLGMGYSLIFIPDSPLHLMELGEVQGARRELGKLCVMQDG